VADAQALPGFLAPWARTVTDEDGRPARLIAHYLTERFWRSAEPAADGRLAVEQPVYESVPIFFAARAIRR
jgi:hypothetical protein